MFTVYHSNKIDLLKTLVATIIAGSPLRNPFKSEFIIVNSTCMAQWMQIELAKQFGIAANIEFQIPEKFIYNIFMLFFKNLKKDSMLTKQVITWQLILILPYMCKNAEFKCISNYLQDDYDNRKCFKLSALLANIFDQYMVFRPDWLESWLHGKLLDGLGVAQRWQAMLWRELMIFNNYKINTNNIYHRANIYKNFISILENSITLPTGLPDRFFVFCISSMPPIYLQVLHALGRHINVHLLFTNPCRYYFGDIYYGRINMQKYKKNINKYNEEQNFVVNPILASYGKLLRDNIYLLSQLNEVQEVDAFVKIDGYCLLSILQRDILELEDNTSIDKLCNNSRRKLQPEDRSLSINICYSIQREVEVLHDRLLAMMTDDPLLEPRDIIVMVADIDNYTPIIQSVFCNAAAGRYLPFSISDIRARYIHPVLPALLSLLELPSSRFTIENVLTLLDINAIANRFEMNEDMLKLLRNWSVQSDICWELDDETMYIQDTSYKKNTCKLGNMFFGYAKNDRSCNLHRIISEKDYSVIISDIIENLFCFLKKLRSWRYYLTEHRPIADWLCCIRDIINDFFIHDIETEAALSILEKHWLQILQYGLDAKYNKLVSIILLHDKLIASLDQEIVKNNFINCAINFCTIMPMRSIPFKVICLLGMNDGVYPRSIQYFSFDLMSQQNRIGDLSRNDDDRYMFIEALISAKQCFYISFIGIDIDNIYPSCLVSELIEYIANSFYLPGYEHTDVDTSAAIIRENLLQLHSRIAKNFIYKEKNIFSELLPAAEASKSSKNKNYNFIKKFDISASALKTLSLDELKIFYSHPVRTWFQKRLSVFFNNKKIIDVEEHFRIDNMTRYQLNYMIVKALIYLQDTKLLFLKVRAAGKLPYGAFGELYWNKQCNNMKKLAEQVREMRLPERKNMLVEIALGDTKISGLLHKVQADGILRWRPRHLSMKDGLMLWLEHLVYCAIGGKGDSRMFGIHGKWHFAPLPAAQAKVYLMYLVSGYYNGMKKPLFLLNRSGGSWLKKCFDIKLNKIDWNKNSQLKARSKLLHTWYGDAYVIGEGEDPYLKRLIRQQLNDIHIDAIIYATQCYLLPPFMLNLA